MNTLRTRKTGYKPDGTLPLINIVLLLVLAFMMAGTFAEPLPADFDPLRSESAVAKEETKQAIVLTMDTEGVLSLEGRGLAAAELEPFLHSLSKSGHVLEVRTDARTPAVLVIALLQSAESLGVATVQIVTLGRR